MNSVTYGDNTTSSGGSRIAFVNGDIDPFHYGGVTQNTSAAIDRGVIAYMVRGGSHCADMGVLDPERDSKPMAAVKAAKLALVAQWLHEMP